MKPIAPPEESLCDGPDMVSALVLFHQRYTVHHVPGERHVLYTCNACGKTFSDRTDVKPFRTP